MKKIIITAASIMMIGVASVYAQTPATPGTTSPTMQQSDQRASDWSKVDPDQVPASLQQTLKANKYKGWENSDIYYNKSTSQYSVDAKNGSATSTYRFDKNGLEIPKSASSSSSTSKNPTSTTPKP